MSIRYDKKTFTRCECCDGYYKYYKDGVLTSQGFFHATNKDREKSLIKIHAETLKLIKKVKNHDSWVQRFAYVLFFVAGFVTYHFLSVAGAS